MKVSLMNHPRALPAPAVPFRRQRGWGDETRRAPALSGDGADLEARFLSASRFGHRLSPPSVRDSAEIFQSAPPFRPHPPGAAPIQRVIDEGLLHEDFADTATGGDLSRLIQQHNERETKDPGARKGKEAEQQYLHAQLKDLDKIEHKAYRWFDTSEEDDPKRKSMFQLLDKVQEHHRKLIGRTASGGHDLWVKDDVGQEGRKDVNKVWEQVVGNQGNLSLEPRVESMGGGEFTKVPQKEYGALRGDLLSDVARLMSRPKGRKLVKHLYKQGKNEDRQVNFRMHGLNILDKGETSPRADETSEEAHLQESDGGIVKGKGSGALVSLTPGLKDSDFSDFGKGSKRIPSPTFITLGHELTHAAHFQAGTSAKGVGSEDALKNKDYHGDLEERLTIEKTSKLQEEGKAEITKESGQDSLGKLLEMNKDIPTEDDIRKEHGLSLRYGHTSMATPEMYPGSKKGSDPGDFVKRPQKIAKDIDYENRPWYGKPKNWLAGGLGLAATLLAYYGPSLYRRYMGM